MRAEIDRQGADSQTLQHAPLQCARLQQVEQLFSGRLGRAEAEALVRRSGARFLLSDCHGRADIGALLARVTVHERRFGCATVWEVR
jgi:hypothetical protein